MNQKRLTQSLRDACGGIVFAYRHEQNLRIQTAIAVFALILGVSLRFARSEWIVLLFLILAVLLLELLNSAVERMLDVMRPRLQAQVKVVKDVMAGTVLLSSVGALVIGALLVWPHVVELLM